jgi:acyl dehydratase
MDRLTALVGTPLEPAEHVIDPDRAQALARLTGAPEPGGVAPPGWAAAVVFSGARPFLQREELKGADPILVEQRFAFRAPLRLGARLVVHGHVESVVPRGPLVAIRILLEARERGCCVLEAATRFVLGTTTPRATDDDPSEGDDVFRATRGDIAHWARLVGESPAIHITDEAARRAGFEGLPVPGLFALAWMLGRSTPTKVRARFRRPLLIDTSARLHHGPEVDGIHPLVLGPPEAPYVTATITAPRSRRS